MLSRCDETGNGHSMELGAIQVVAPLNAGNIAGLGRSWPKVDQMTRQRGQPSCLVVYRLNIQLLPPASRLVSSASLYMHQLGQS